jgi:hypothetical protein
MAEWQKSVTPPPMMSLNAWINDPNTCCAQTFNFISGPHVQRQKETKKKESEKVIGANKNQKRAAKAHRMQDRQGKGGHL